MPKFIPMLLDKKRIFSQLLLLLALTTVSFCFLLPNPRSTNLNEYVNTSVVLEWEKTYDDFNISCGTDIAVDSENNIIILGNYYNSSTEEYTYFLLKYDNNGIKMWNLPLDYQVYGINAIGIDSLDNIYVAGELKLNTTNSDLLLSKYNRSGELQWQKTWGDVEYDCAYTVCVDSLDNIYMVGETNSYGLEGQIIILKYKNSGDLQWSANWTCSDTNFACDVKADFENNIFITGYSILNSINNVFLVKFNSTGDFQWNKTWGGLYTNIGYSLAIDSSNNLYITGLDQGAGGYYNDIFVYNVNNQGDLLWNYTYGCSGHQIGYSIALDSKENIYVSGTSKGNVFLMKLNKTGSKLWDKTWGSEHSEQAYGMAIDDSDNILFTGYEQQEFDGDEYLLFLKFSSRPDEFTLSSNADAPDPDGCFSLNWTESLDAENYSLYQSSMPIFMINKSVTEILKGNVNRTYSFSNLSEGLYYFIVIAFNQYGNTSSNCVKVKVQYPPDEFTLYNNNTEIPDTDGIVNLTWSASEGADYYCIYEDNEEIHEISIEHTLVANNLTERCFTIENLTNGEYYYIILAMNEAGETFSNCIHIPVRRAPDHFVLSSDAGTPYDDDGAFELIWTHSKYAINYTVYISNWTITIINDSVNELYTFKPSFEWPTYRYSLCHCSGTGLSNGTYYFIVVASNEYGSYKTECYSVVVSIKSSSQDQSHDNADFYKIFNNIIVTSFLIGVLGLLIIVYYKRRK